MSWIFGTIDFATYGVMVSRSSGVLDLPKLQHEGFNWLDEDGLDYWQDDTKYSEREIILNCWMYAEKDETYSGYVNFRSKVLEFTDAVIAAGKVSFVTPYVTIANCSISKGVTIIRETNYVQDVQVGTFTLRITVPGDSQYNLITIKRWTGGAVTYPEVVKTKNLAIRKDLQSDISLSLTVESNVKLDIIANDWIDYTYPGGNSDRFYMVGPPQFDKKSSNKFNYNLNFQFYGFALMKRAEFLNDLLESDFAYYANIEEILDLIITNYERRGFGTGQFTKGTVDITPRRNHKFSGENCFEVLQRICKEYELEYEFIKNSPDWWNYTINIKEQIANDKAITFEYGKGNGLYEISRGERLNDKYFTVLYAYGSDKNIPAIYRSGMRRLSFTGNPLINSALDDSYIEKTMFFDEIFPHFTGTVLTYTHTPVISLTDAEKEVWPNGIYLVTASMDFDLNDYLLGGVTPKIVMKTGDLAGYEFDIAKIDYDSIGQICSLYIIPVKDTSDYVLPNDTILIAEDDEFTFIDIDQPEGYITSAEAELAAAAAAALVEGSNPQFQYSVIVDPKFIADNSLYIEIGDRFTLVDTDYDVDTLMRVSRLTYNDYTGKYEIAFAENYIKSRIKEIETTLDIHERAFNEIGIHEVDVMRNNQESPGEIKRKLLDTLDEKLNADAIIRVNSLDPGMMALDVDSNVYAQILVELNVTDEDGVHINPGTITVTNWDTKDRFQIQKMTSEGQTYDPSRTWIVPDTSISLPTKDPYVLYAKLDLTPESTDCTIEAHIDHVEGKKLISTGYLYKRILPITGGEE